MSYGVTETRDSQGNLLVSMTDRIEADAFEFRISKLMLEQMYNGAAFLVTMDRTDRGLEPRIEVIPHYRLYNR